MKKGFVVLLALVMTFSMILSGCGGAAASSTAAPAASAASGGSVAPAGTTFGITPMADRTTLRLGYFAGVQHSLPFYAADQLGYFDELNIDVEYLSFTTGPAMCEASSSWDLGGLGGPGALTGMMTYDIKTISTITYDTLLDLYCRPDSPIVQSGKGHLPDYPEIYGTAEDWKGTTWLLPMGTTLYKTLSSTLEKFGLTIDDVTVINMDVSSAQAGFKSGEGDGMGQWSTLSKQAEDAGYIRVSGVQAALDDRITCHLVATPDALANKAELLAIAYEVYYRTVGWVEENHDQAVAYYMESCETEGILVDGESAETAINALISFPLEEALAMHTTMVDDPQGKADRQLNQVEADLFEVFDFFIEMGIYTDENREFVLNNHMVDNSIAELVAANLAAR